MILKSAKSGKSIGFGVLLGILSLVFNPITLSCLCIVGMYGFIYYTTARRPAPEPYPGVVVSTPVISIGAGRREYHFEYTVDRSLDEMTEYYETEMDKYCVDDDWQFEVTENACPDYIECRVANCDIEAGQWFLIYLRSVSPTRTNVMYFHETADP